MSSSATCSLCDAPLADPVGALVKTFGAAKYRLCASCRADFEREMQRYALIGQEEVAGEQGQEAGRRSGAQGGS